MCPYLIIKSSIIQQNVQLRSEIYINYSPDSLPVLNTQAKWNPEYTDDVWEKSDNFPSLDSEPHLLLNSITMSQMCGGF